MGTQAIRDGFGNVFCGGENLLLKFWPSVVEMEIVKLTCDFLFDDSLNGG